jgi:hypothetical protein
MSRTFHHHGSYVNSLLKIEKKELVDFYWKKFYSKSPKWWRKYYKHKPNRTQTRKLLNKQIQNPEQDLIYPHHNKPIFYYL